MNCYATVDDMQSRLSVSENVEYFLTLLNAASRVADQMSGRHFYTETATKYFSGTHHPFLVLPDLQSVTTLKTDPIRNETYSDSWVEGTDYVLEPQDKYPRMKLRKKVHMPNGFTLIGGKAWLEITGVWGAGNMRNANPWILITGTATVADGTTTTLTLSSGHGVKAGMTIKIGSEQLFVSASATTTATVIRGVNGTTAAAHTTAAISKAEYPAEVVRGTQAVACMMFRDMQRTGIQSETIGNYAYSLSNPVHTDGQIRRLFGMVRREPWL
jgi:hypothetical protein